MDMPRIPSKFTSVRSDLVANLNTEHLQNALSSGEDSDFSIFVFDERGRKYEKKVHKLVIRQCPYFAAMLDLKGKEAKKGSVTIEDINYEIFDYILRYIYTDSLGNVTMEQAIKVAVAADYLQLEDLRKAALDSWKASLVNLKEKKAVLEQFRALIASSLNIGYDESWHEARDTLLIAIHSDSIIRKESRTFIINLINLFGDSHPCFAAFSLADWVSEVTGTKKQQNALKNLTAELLEEIRWNGFSLQTLAILSKTEAFPMSYMMKVIQEKVDNRDLPAHDKVKYTMKAKTFGVCELEFEGTYVLFHFMGFRDDMDGNTVVWELINVPDDFNTKVKLLHPRKENKSWPVNTKQGTAQDMRLYQLESGDFEFMVILGIDDRDENVTFYYNDGFNYNEQ